MAENARDIERNEYIPPTQPAQPAQPAQPGNNNPVVTTSNILGIAVTYFLDLADGSDSLGLD